MANGSSLTMVQKARRVNLKRLVDKLFGGNASEAARKLRASHQYLWQLLKGDRGMGERSAREIEEALKLEPGYLDTNKELRDTEVTLSIGEGETKTFRYVPVRALASPDVKSEDLGFHLCPSEHCPPNAFVVVADGGTEETTAAFVEGELLFIDPFTKGDKLVNKGHYVVSLVGKKNSGRVLQARAYGEDGWVFATSNPDHKRREYPYGELKVVGRIMLVVRQLP